MKNKFHRAFEFKVKPAVRYTPPCAVVTGLKTGTAAAGVQFYDFAGIFNGNLSILINITDRIG